MKVGKYFVIWQYPNKECHMSKKFCNTFCIIKDENNKVISIGMSRRHPNDNMDKNKARKLSLERALKVTINEAKDYKSMSLDAIKEQCMLNFIQRVVKGTLLFLKETRISFWEAYRTLGKEIRWGNTSLASV